MTLRRREFVAAAAASTLNAGCASPSRAPLDVVVLGAGLAGLNAALSLEAAGARVCVLEASARVGGRVHTLDDLPWRPEAGGGQIGAAYQHTLAVAQRLQLALEPNARSPLLRDERLLMHVNGQRLTRTEWLAAANNPLADPLRALTPDRAMARLIGSSPLHSASAWRDAAFHQHDVAADAVLRTRGANEETLRLMAVNNSYGDSLAETSLLQLFHVQSNALDAAQVPGPVQNMVGGNQRLPQAMAAALRGDLLLQRAALRVSAHQHGVVVHDSAGTRHAAGFVVCALPLPAMRQVAFDPGLPAAHAHAVLHVPYARVTQLHVQVLRPFWQDDGLAPYLWSDGPLARMFPIDPQANGQAPGLLVWANGARAAQWDTLDDAAAAAQLMQALAAVYPSARGAVKLVRRIAWHQQPAIGGAWANWRPGQIAGHAAAVAAPHGRLHFAGEHTGAGLRGIEAAMSSGQRAALEVLARL
jgi:monoamine oxidase